MTFSLSSMSEFTHEELQSVILRYDSKYKEAKNTIREKTEQASKLDVALQTSNRELTDEKLMNEMQMTNNGQLKEALNTQTKEIESLQKLCKIYEAEGEKNDELEAKLETLSQLLQKEKDLNASLVSQAGSSDGTSGTGTDASIKVF